MAASVLSVLFTLAVAAAEPPNLIVNGGFEQGLAGWSELWTRTPGGRLTLDRQERHGGEQAARVEHTGREDWSLAQLRPIEVSPGQCYELSGWVRVRGGGDTTLCVTPRDRQGQVIDWIFAGQTTRVTDGWRQLRARFVVPRAATSIQPRLIGTGAATVWLDDVRLVLRGSLDELRRKDLPPVLRAESPHLSAALDTADGSLTVTDRRGGRRWAQRARSPIVVLDAKAAPGGFDLRLLDPVSMLRLAASVRLDERRPEISVALSLELKGTALVPLDEKRDGPPEATAHSWAFPQPFLTDRQTLLILPLNEGISYPADDQGIEPAYHYFYGGHGLCMGWYGQSDGRAGVMTIVESPDDAGVRLFRQGGLLALAPEWEPQRGQFGYARRLRWVFLDGGGYVAMCKRYRQQAAEKGLLRTLSDKRAANPNVDLLVGAVNVWCWDPDAVGICRQMLAAGIDRILWSNRAEPATLGQLNALGVLTSRYDIYQDVMDPANFPKLRWVHSDWTTAGWPKDLMLDAGGRWIPGWEVEGKDGQWYPCGVLCDRRAPDYARRRIGEELKTHPYRCRFIDTTTAAPWRECYHPEHPLTRSESRHWKMELLRLVSEDYRLVTGSETGHEAAVPYVHYFEGMLSLGPYRVPDAGRDMQRIWPVVPPPVAKFQTGHFYRLPLWELVFHDCLVAHWYWGDYNNKLPAVWARRDLWNALYGTPPMFMFTRQAWQAQRERFVESYRTAAAVARATGYAQMLAHRWLTPDHAVQETRFGGGVTVTVNFGPQPYALPGGGELGPLAHRVDGPGGAAR